MIIQEAIKSGKPFKRKKWLAWVDRVFNIEPPEESDYNERDFFICAVFVDNAGLSIHEDTLISNLEDLLSDDWEVKNEDD